MIAGVAAGLVVVLTPIRTLIFKRSVHGLSRDESASVSCALNAAFVATHEAFQIAPGDAASENDARVTRASEAAAKFNLAIEAAAPRLGRLADGCAKFGQLVSDAQLQVMAFAINRKNRGETGGADFESEIADRKVFMRDAQPIVHDLSAALGSR